MFEKYNDVATIDDLRKMLCIGRNKAYQLVNSGKIYSFKIGKQIRIPKSNIIDYLYKYERQKLEVKIDIPNLILGEE